MTSIRSKFQSCPNELKLNIQSLLTLLIIKMSHLSILSQNVEVFAVTEHIHCTMQISNLGYCINFHNFASKLTNEIFLQSDGSGGFGYSISGNLDNFEILTLESVRKKKVKVFRSAVTWVFDVEKCDAHRRKDNYCISAFQRCAYSFSIFSSFWVNVKRTQRDIFQKPKFSNIFYAIKILVFLLFPCSGLISAFPISIFPRKLPKKAKYFLFCKESKADSIWNFFWDFVTQLKID